MVLYLDSAALMARVVSSKLILAEFFHYFFYGYYGHYFNLATLVAGSDSTIAKILNFDKIELDQGLISTQRISIFRARN